MDRYFVIVTNHENSCLSLFLDFDQKGFSRYLLFSWKKLENR